MFSPGRVSFLETLWHLPWETLKKKELDNTSGSQLPYPAQDLETDNWTPNHTGVC